MQNTFFFGKRNEHRELGRSFSVHKGIISAVKRVEFVSDRNSYIILRGRWCDIAVLNFHAPTGDKLEALHIQQISLQESNSNTVKFYDLFLTFMKVIFSLKNKLIVRRNLPNNLS
jgi:hypothetical protein